MQPSETAWELRVRVSKGDNGGIASYGAVLIAANGGAPGITSLHHATPAVLDPVGDYGFPVPPLGFTLLRSRNGVANTNIGASQDTFAPTPLLIYGFGQTAGSAADFGLVESAVRWDANPLVAFGDRLPGAQLSLDPNNVLTLVNVFITAGHPATKAGAVAPLWVYPNDPFPDPWPEPTSASLAGIVCLGLAQVRRHAGYRLSRLFWRRG